MWGNPFSPHYIGFLPAADVIEAEPLDAEALLRPVETPQPLALNGTPLALPPLATPETTPRGERDKDDMSVDPGTREGVGFRPVAT